MTIPITQSPGRFRTLDPTDPGWLSRLLRLLLMGASLALNPTLAVAQTATSSAASAPDDGQWTMPAKNYAATIFRTR
jgi:hypothetical protein